MLYPEELIEEIRQKNDIVEVLSGYVALQKKGSNYVCCCPFHSEKTPSFSVNQTRQIYKCFGCGEGGNVITFIQKYENYSFPEAVKLLADRAGVTLPEQESNEETRKRETKRQRILAVNKEAAAYYYYRIREKGGEDALSYLINRGLSAGTIRKFGLGYAPQNNHDFLKYLKDKGYEDDILLAAGLAGFHEQRGLYGKFWNRVMFPIQDMNHRVIGFGGRVMGEGEPKYLNSQETEVFDKSRNLYGLNLARTSRKDFFILCEGYMDVISMHQAGFSQAVASLGTAFTEGQAGLIRRFVKTVYLAYDSDGAGVKAALRAITILRTADITAKVINLLPYKDPDEFCKNLGTEAFENRIKEAENSFLFELRMAERNYDMSDPESKTRFDREIASRICAFSEEQERENYIQAVASKYQMGYESLRKLVFSVARQTGFAAPVLHPKSGMEKKTEDPGKKAQKLLLTWLCEEPGLFQIVRKYINTNDFTVDIYQKAAERIFSDLDKGELNPAMVISMFEDADEQSDVSSLFTTKLEEINTESERTKAFHDILMSVKRNSFEAYANKAGSDIGAVASMIEAKKTLEELSKTHISLK